MRLRSGGAYAAELPHAALLPHDVLVRIFSFLPRGALDVTPGRACRAWAAAKREAWAAALAAAALEAQLRTSVPNAHLKFPPSRYEKLRPYLPLWYVRGVVGDALDAAKRTMMAGACFHGLIDVVEELCAAGQPELCGTRPCEAAAAGSRLDVLVFLRERGFPMDESTCHAAAKAGNVPILQFAHEQGCNWNEWTSAFAAAGGHLNALMFLCEHGLPLGERACAEAARWGHLHILRWACEEGCPWSTSPLVLYHAADNGQFEIIKWLRQQGCAWHENTIGAAATTGDLQMVQWMRAQGCPFDNWACRDAAYHGHLELLQYLVEQGCPINVKQCIKAAENHPACREWLKTLLPAAAQ